MNFAVNVLMSAIGVLAILLSIVLSDNNPLRAEAYRDQIANIVFLSVTLAVTILAELIITVVRSAAKPESREKIIIPLLSVIFLVILTFSEYAIVLRVQKDPKTALNFINVAFFFSQVAFTLGLYRLYSVLAKKLL